jgi:hypothetical protein
MIKREQGILLLLDEQIRFVMPPIELFPNINPIVLTLINTDITMKSEVHTTLRKKLSQMFLKRSHDFME